MNGQTVTNPQITDQLGRNHQYVVGSAVATSPIGRKIPVTATANGTQVTFSFKGKVTTNINLTYRTTTTNDSGAETFSNAALYHDDNGHNAAANATISREAVPSGPDENENPNVTPPGPTDPGKPTEPGKPQPTGPIDLTKSVAWADPEKPTTLNWTVTITGNGHPLVNPEIIDRLSSNQSYLPGSAKAIDSNGQTLAVVDDHSGTEVSFKMAGTHTGTIKLTYQSTTDNPSGKETFDNAADYHDDNGNEASATAEISRDGDEVEPEIPPGESTPIKMKKTAAWSEPNDFTKITWRLAVTANGNQLINPQITDQLSDNHQYIENSVTATTASGTAIPVTATVAGQTIVFKLAGTFNENLSLDYQTRTTSPTGAAVFNNAAIYEDDAGNNAAADASIDRDATIIEPELPGKKAIEMTKSATWARPDDFTNILWTITMNANDNQLINPQFTDDGSPALTYVENSAQAIDSTGQSIPVNVVVNGQQLIFMLRGTFTDNLKLTYLTKTVTPTGAATYANVVVYDDDNDNEATADATIDRPEIPVKPPVTNPGEPGQPGKPEPPVTNPGEPGQPSKPEPPITNPGEPGQPSKPEPPITNPGEPGQPSKPEPPVINPGEPGQPSKPEPPVTNPSEPGQPSKPEPPVIKPSEPEKPTATHPPVTAPGEATQPEPSTSSTPEWPSPTQPTTAPPVTMPADELTTTEPVTAGTAATTTLPQTNEHHTSLAALLGAGLLLILAALGYWKRRPEH
ncbi:cell surface protein [Lactiplantibacillus fabifermentans T30PCM01]|uniref:Cell surface protein n=1 Tax=Lactiplantibacillus fabifermentans T30PCM01 TaxID=1400520 RepID=W6TBF7_9LACO|nr:LPXTG cell wall anchor domain-containing protein [Lactiplantibacillus fabifermentans]ETY72560.1 cell surface protein [Lactiplantibacillus fabifermentans T30PCM01]